MSGVLPPLQNVFTTSTGTILIYLHSVGYFVSQSRDTLCICNVTSKRMRLSYLSHCTRRGHTFEVPSLVGWYAVSTGKYLPTFRKSEPLKLQSPAVLD